MKNAELKEAVAKYIESKELVLMGYSPEYIDDVKNDMEVAFRAGAEWMSGQFVLVGGEPTDWFRANDGSEYATGLDLKEPIKLPVDFYVRKK